MRLRAVFFVVGVAALVVYGWLAVGVRISEREPESFTAWNGPHAWIAGPPADALEAAATGHLDRALDLLDGDPGSSAESYRAYRDELRAAEALLIESLRARPAQARVLTMLAAVRWELNPPGTDEAAQRHLRTIFMASEMAPTMPRVQLELGGLLLKMGRREEARSYFQRTVELDPTLSGDVVTRLDENSLGLDEMLRAAPQHPGVLAALQTAFFEESRQAEYLHVLDDYLDRDWTRVSPELIAAYGATCRRTGEATRLLERMNALGPTDDAAVDAERLRQRSLAHLALHDNARAIDDALAARELQPTSARFVEHQGDVLLAGEEADRAIGVFHEALVMVARNHDAPRWRARLGRKIGEAEERRGNIDLAYERYKMALRLDPGELHAKRRVAEMERAAGRNERED